MKGETKETYVNSMKSSRTINHLRCLYGTDVSRTISVQIADDDDRDGPRNVGFLQTSDVADSPRRLHRTNFIVQDLPLKFGSFSVFQEMPRFYGV